MKEIVNIGLITGIQGEWTGTINIKVNESYEELIERIKINQMKGTKIMEINSIRKIIKAINIDYITNIWIEEVEDEI